MSFPPSLLLPCLAPSSASQPNGPGVTTAHRHMAVRGPHRMCVLFPYASFTLILCFLTSGDPLPSSQTSTNHRR